MAGGSREYVRRLTAPYADRIRRGCPVTSVRRLPNGVLVEEAGGRQERFEEVVIATHADQALRLLADPVPEESAVLGAFRYEPNHAVLHRDPALMPRRRGAWASWNYLSNGRQGAAARVSVTYWMNRLQSIDPRLPLFVSLNPIQPPRPDLVHAEFLYDHPQFDVAALDAQKRIGTIQGRRRTWFCGSYCGYGFHEDGLAAGLAVAEALGAQRPWTCTEMSTAAAHCRPVASDLTLAAE